MLFFLSEFFSSSQGSKHVRTYTHTHSHRHKKLVLPVHISFQNNFCLSFELEPRIWNLCLLSSPPPIFPDSSPSGQCWTDCMGLGKGVEVVKWGRTSHHSIISWQRSLWSDSSGRVHIVLSLPYNTGHFGLTSTPGNDCCTVPTVANEEQGTSLGVVRRHCFLG